VLEKNSLITSHTKGDGRLFLPTSEVIKFRKVKVGGEGMRSTASQSRRAQSATHLTCMYSSQQSQLQASHDVTLSWCLLLKRFKEG